MELLYIWIEEYRNIKKQGFNFSSQYRFYYDSEYNKLTIDDNPSYIPYFFPKNISNVTAIIGENGSGKTSLLDFVRAIFTWSVWEKTEELLAIVKNNNEYHIHCYQSVWDKIKLVNQSNIEVVKQVHTKWPSTGFNLHFVKNRAAKNAYSPIIYFSNIFHEKSVLSKSAFNEVDISTNFLLQSELNAPNLENPNYIFNYRLSEIKKQISFITDQSSPKPKFPLPEKVSIKVTNTINNDKNLSPIEKYLIKEFTYEIRMLKGITYDGDDENSKKRNIENIHKETHLSILQATIYNFFENKNKIKNLKKSNYSPIGKNSKEKFLDYFKNFNSENASNKEVEDYIEYITTKLCKAEIIEKNKEFSLDIDESKVFFDKYQEYINSFGNGVEYIDFDWRDISSGEKAFLSFYARFYSTLNLVATKQDLIILIDEGETSFHPQWQKEYLKNSIDFFSQIYAQKNIQIIFTSHSPFLVSDLPNSNIIFMEKDKESGNAIVKNGLNDMKQTFGANIHTLLTDSFFMKNGLMGSFAKEKIDNVINKLNENKDLDFEQIQKEISIIGEPIIKNQLQKMLDSKRLSEVDRIKKDIDNLKQRLEKLENDDTNQA